MALHDRDYMRDQPARRRRTPSRLAGWNVLHWIIAANAVVFLLQHIFEVGWAPAAFPGGRGQPMGGVSIDALLEGQVWTLLTSLFVHQGPMHLALNLVVIWLAGSRVLPLLGGRAFVQVYFLSGVIGLALQLAVSYFFLGSSSFTIVGASGCALGLVGAFAAIMPHESVTVMLYFIIPWNVTMRQLGMALVCVNVALGISALAWQGAPWAGYASFAHLGGILAGWYYVQLLGYGGQPMTYEQLWKQQAASVPKPQRREVARVRRSRAAPEMDDEALKRRQDRRGRNSSPVVEEIDPILDKISTFGMGSLTEGERRQLEAASREIAGRDRPRNAQF